MTARLDVAFVFASRGIGGAERSMLRLMARAHPDPFACRVVVPARENALLRAAVAAIDVPYHSLAAADAAGLFRLLRRAHPDVLYVFGRFRTIPWSAVARLAGVRCIVAAERSSASRWSDRLARRLDRYLVDAYVANSEHAARNLRAVVGDQTPVRVVPNGIADEPLPPRQPDEGAAPSLLCIGNITPNKGQGVLIEAVRMLRARHPAVRATLVGQDFTRGRFFRAAAERGLGDTYRAVGFAADVRPFLARADVVVLPTLEREGMPTALLEAMRAGVPVVATRVGGVCEIVEEGRTGLLVPPGDAGRLAAAIECLLADAGMRERLAATARAYASGRHHVSVMVEGHRAAFREALLRRQREGSGSARERAPEGSASVAHVTAVARSLRGLLLDQLCTLRDHGYEVTGVSSPGPEVSALAAHGIRHVPVPITRRLTPLADARSLVRLYRLMRGRRFTIVHTHTPKPGLLGQLAARLAGVPVVVNTIHGFYFHDRSRPAERRFYVALEKLAARCSDVILSQNEEDVATALAEGIARRGQIRHLGNGIDLGRFDPARLGVEARRRMRASFGIPEDAPVVGFVGRLVAEKGVPELLEAVRIVRQRHPAVRLLLVGSSDDEKADSLSPEGAGAADGGGCLFAGYRRDMPELYEAMDVFVLPSHREGLPRAPMEAAAMRLPCVVTDVRGCRQTVRDGENGLLVPVADPRALAAAISSLLADRGLARRLGEQGRRRALTEFDERRVFATVLSEYERLLAAKGLRAPVPLPAGQGRESAGAVGARR